MRKRYFCRHRCVPSKHKRTLYGYSPHVRRVKIAVGRSRVSIILRHWGTFGVVCRWSLFHCHYSFLELWHRRNYSCLPSRCLIQISEPTVDLSLKTKPTGLSYLHCIFLGHKWKRLLSFLLGIYLRTYRTDRVPWRYMVAYVR